MAKTIEFEIGPLGEINIETKGFSGPEECRKATADIEKALGKVISEQLTAEGRKAPEAKPRLKA